MGAKMTTATSRGLAKVTFDKDFQDHRDRELRLQPGNASQGVISGMRMFARGVSSGVTGIVTTPVREGKKGGVGKGILGVGKGVLGIFAKPASGAMDMISCTLRGIESSVFGKDSSERSRLPRHTHPSGKVVPFSLSKAQGVHFLHKFTALRDQFCDIPYVAHITEQIHQDEKKNERKNEKHIQIIFALYTRIVGSLFFEK